jgi:hypothetical protein
VNSRVLHRTDCISYNILLSHTTKMHHGVKVWIHTLKSALVSGQWSAPFMWKQCMVHTAQRAGRVPDRVKAVGETNISAYHKSVATHHRWLRPSWAVTLHLRTLMIHKNRPSSQIFLDLTRCHRVRGSVKGWAVRKESPSWSARPLKMKHYVPSKCQESLPQRHCYIIQKDLNPQTHHCEISLRLWNWNSG